MRVLWLFAALPLTVAACGSDDGSSDEATVTGEVVLEEPDALGDADGAVLTVQLVDISLADAPAEVIDAEEIPLDGSPFPVPYELAYDPSEINESNTYAVQARVEVGGVLLAINDTVHPAITNGSGTAGIDVVLIVITPAADS